MARPSIVPIALTLDDRTGYTLWAPPWEEDGEEWQAFLGTTEDDDETAAVDGAPLPHPRRPRGVLPHAAPTTTSPTTRSGRSSQVSAPPTSRRTTTTASTSTASTTSPPRTPTAGRSRSSPPPSTSSAGWPSASTPRRATTRTTTTTDDEGQFEAVAELVAKPEIGSLGLGVEAFVGRSGEDAWIGVGGVLDDLWEDVVEELSEHLDWTGAGTASTRRLPAPPRPPRTTSTPPEDVDEAADGDVAGAAAAAAAPGVRTIARGGRLDADPRRRSPRPAEFWESVGILPVEIVVPEGAGVTLRCYVEDVARFLGRDGEIYLFDSPADLARFCAGAEDHDLTEIASWPEVADTDVPPLPADQDRYDLTELSEVLGEVADGAAGLVDHRAFAQPVEGVRDLAEYAGLTAGRGAARAVVPAGPGGRPGRAGAGRHPPRRRTPPCCDRCGTRSCSEVSGALVFRD